MKPIFMKFANVQFTLYSAPPRVRPPALKGTRGMMPKNCRAIGIVVALACVGARASEPWPNKITKADFADWVEQRGSKFWNTWDPAYRPMIATWDRGQAVQQGGWLWTRHAKGHYTDFAYAMHRQLPYGVPRAYRLMANLLA
jgi:hypothetical protein